MDRNNQHIDNTIPNYKHPKKPQKKLISTKLVIILIVMLSLGSSLLMFYKYNTLKDTTSQTLKQNEELSRSIADKLKKIVLIESTEKPYIATITDVDKIKSQTPTNTEFYKNAKNNDFLIIYPDRAYIYRDSDNQIINFAPIVKDSVDNQKPADGVNPAQ